jgi:hypothetical protein
LISKRCLGLKKLALLFSGKVWSFDVYFKIHRYIGNGFINGLHL